VAFSVAANSGSARSGTLTIAGQTYTVSQDGAACTYSISPASQNVAAGGGMGSAAVMTSSGCSWTVSSNAGWINVTSGASGSGNGSFSFTVAANSGAARSGTMSIAGQTFTVNQDAMACTFSVAPTTVNIGAGPDGGSVTVTASGGCSWTATANADWLSITGGASGAGAGTVSFSAGRNRTGSVRIGTLTVAGQVVTIMQSGS